MTRSDVTQSMIVTTAVINALLLTLQGSTGLQGSQTRSLCNQLLVTAQDQLSSGNPKFWADLTACFEAAQQAGATFVTMDAVRIVADGLVVTGVPAIAIKNFSIRMALAELARILAATDFVSRQDIEGYFDQINASFEAAEIVAADARDNVSYVALITIHAAVSNDLANRARPLARMISYTFPTNLPSLALAQRIYYDPSRADELVAENKPIHPLFMPPSGVALSS
jgi:prophage DNA circulation protein